MNIKICKLKIIGSGTQADVYTCKLKDDQTIDTEVYVTKTKKIVDNLKVAE